MIHQAYPVRSRATRPRSSAAALLAALALAPTAGAGNGHHDTAAGTFDFCVSVRFDANAAQLATIRDRFEAASQILADATDGQHRFGEITIVNGSGASQTAEFWIHEDAGRARATFGQYGVRGQHVSMFFPSDFSAVGAAGMAFEAFTVAHEFAHHAYGVADEYAKFVPGIVPGTFDEVPAECAAPGEEGPLLSYCLMDNYFSRGGGAVLGGLPTLNEFCVAGNHDPDGDTMQECLAGTSCWEQMAAGTRFPLAAPAGLPVGAAPAAQAVGFADGADGLRIVLVIDRSGSMNLGGKLPFAKEGAGEFVDVLEVGDGLGVVSFNDVAAVDYALATIAGGADEAAALAAIDALVAFGSTNVTDGLQQALAEITAQPLRTCNEVIVLLSDGDHNVGPAPGPALLDTLGAEGVTVFTVGVGTALTLAGEALLQDLADATGGRYYRVADAAGLMDVMLRVAEEASGNGLLAAAPQQVLSASTSSTPVLIEPGVSRASFTLVLAEASDGLALPIVSPEGKTISGPQSFSPHSRRIEVDDPVPGTWTVEVTAGQVQVGTFTVLVAAEHDGVQVNVGAAGGGLSAPEPFAIRATPNYEGISVVNAELSGRVLRPDGSEVPIALTDGGDPGYHRFLQFEFDRQWRALRGRAAAVRVRLLGDVPIFVERDSADVRAHPELFRLDARGRPRLVTGVPPDSFSSTGQLWGHPHYAWAAHRKTGFRWWIERFERQLSLFDAVRVDHFIGFHRAWQVPASAETAERGRWGHSPGRALLRALRERRGALPLVAEDLGAVTPEVRALRDAFGLPGMRILQHGFGDGASYDRPHNLPSHCVVYPGTHDNDTVRGWWESLPEPDRRRLQVYAGSCEADVPAALVRLCFSSPACLAVIPLQDLLGLGSEARMNTPATVGGNWTWRLPRRALTARLAEGTRELLEVCERVPR